MIEPAAVSVANHAVLILAAGGSRRLGQPKQLLRYQGETLIRRVVMLAAATAPRCIYTVIGAEQAAIRAELAGMDAKLLVNETWSSGLASSLKVGAAALRDHPGPVLIMVCDQLRLTLAHLQTMLAVAVGEPDHTVASRYGGSIGIPVLAAPALLQSASELNQEQGLKALLQSDRWPLITVQADELDFDLDTPEQVSQAVAEGWLDG